MNEQLTMLAEKINQLSLRERALLFFTFVVLLLFLWWNLWAEPVEQEFEDVLKQNESLKADVVVLVSTTDNIRQRLAEGVYRKEKQKLQQLKQELEKVNEVLQQKTSALIEPDEMFELMRQMVFAESGLKLTGIKRKAVSPLFSADEEKDSQQPKIYRHVMMIGFDGRYRDVVGYIKKIEALPWKLIWDRIQLQATRPPVVHVDIEISTLSDNQSWVGL